MTAPHDGAMTPLPLLERVENERIGYSILVPRGATADLDDLLDAYWLDLGGSDQFNLEVGRHTRRIDSLSAAREDVNLLYPRETEDRVIPGGFLVIDQPASGKQRAYSFFQREGVQYGVMCMSRPQDRDAVIAICESFRFLAA